MLLRYQVLHAWGQMTGAKCLGFGTWCRMLTNKNESGLLLRTTLNSARHQTPGPRNPARPWHQPPGTSSARYVLPGVWCQVPGFGTRFHIDAIGKANHLEITRNPPALRCPAAKLPASFCTLVFVCFDSCLCDALIFGN